MSRYYDDYLVHFQRKGAHWGVKNGPPYPLNSSGLAKFRKKLKEYKDGAEDRKRAKEIKKADKAQAKADKKQAKREERLEQLSKSPTYLWKHKDAYTTEELNKALNRINTEQRIHEASMAELRRGKDVVDTIIGYGASVNNAYSMVKTFSNNYQDFKSTMRNKGSSNNNTNDTNTSSEPQSSPSRNPKTDKLQEFAKKAASKGRETYKKRKERYNASRSKYPGSIDPRMIRF